MKIKTWALLGLLACASGAAFSHGGGLDADGCHTNRKTGDYHCHRGGGGSSVKQQSVAPSAAPPQSTAGGPTCYTGPRGGTYTITKSGRKNYKGC
jgi:hypothetical protein